jgi:hypothetical protein
LLRRGRGKVRFSFPSADRGYCDCDERREKGVEDRDEEAEGRGRAAGALRKGCRESLFC